jgi:hypothetical protein
MRVVNLTPHPIVLRHGGEDRAYQPDPRGPARVRSVPGKYIQADLPLYSAPSWGEVVGLPGPHPGVIYLVSALVAARCAGRTDVFSPGTGPDDHAVRDNSGRIIAVTRLIQAPGLP